MEGGVAGVVGGVDASAEGKGRRDRLDGPPFLGSGNRGAEGGRLDGVVRREVAAVADERAAAAPVVAEPGRGHERRGAVAARRAGVRAGVGEDLHHLRLEEVRREPEGSRADPPVHEREVVAPAPHRRAPGEARVGVGAVGEQSAHERNAGAGVVVGDAAVAKGAAQHRRVQRGVAEGGGVGVGPGAEQQRRERAVAAVGGDDQGGVAVGRGVVDVGAGREEQPGRLDVARPGREEQRGAAALDHLLEGDAPRRRPRRPAAPHVVDPAADDGPGADVGAAVEERPRDGGPPVGDRPHQGGLAAGRLGRVHPRAARQQGVHRRDAAGAGRRHQRGLPAREGGVRVGAGRQQPLDEGAVAPPAGHEQRGDPEVVGRIGVGAGPEQQVRRDHVLVVHRPVQGRRAVRLPGVHVDRSGQPRAQRRGVAVVHRRDQWRHAGWRARLSACGAGGRDERQHRDQSRRSPEVPSRPRRAVG